MAKPVTCCADKSHDCPVRAAPLSLKMASSLKRGNGSQPDIRWDSLCSLILSSQAAHIFRFYSIERTYLSRDTSKKGWGLRMTMSDISLVSLGLWCPLQMVWVRYSNHIYFWNCYCKLSYEYLYPIFMASVLQICFRSSPDKKAMFIVFFHCVRFECDLVRL